MSSNGVFADGGGIVVINGRVVRIPPWEPPILARMKAVAHIARAYELLGPTELAAEVERLAAQLHESVVAEIQPVLDEHGFGDGSISYFDGDGGFCGTVPPKIPPLALPGPKPEPDPWKRAGTAER